LQGGTERTIDSVVVNGQIFNSNIRVIGDVVPNVWQLFEFNAIYVSDGSGGYEWVSIIKVDVVAGDGSGATINNNYDNRLITGTATAGTLNAESNITFDGNNLKLENDKKITFGSNLRMEIYYDSGSNTNYIQLPANGGGAFPLTIKSNAIDALKINSTGNLEDSKGDVRSLGGNAVLTAAYTVVDRTYVGTTMFTDSFDVTINTGVLNQGDAITIMNTHNSARQIIAGTSVELYMAGATSAATPLNLAPNGVATVMCYDTNGTKFVVMGAGVST